MKKIIALFLIFITLSMPVTAKSTVKSQAIMLDGFSAIENMPEQVSFKNNKEIKIDETTIIPINSTILAEICESRTERRWHKSGFFICKIIQYETADSELVELSDKELYFIARKSEKIDKLDSTITGVEIVGSTIASCFLPGIDIIYFFTKGAIQREKHSNWFKAGVFNAYDNSIFWFPQKGKPIELEPEDYVNIKSLSPKKAEKMTQKINNIKQKHKK